MDLPPYDVHLVTYGLTFVWESDPRVANVKEALSKRFQVGDSRSTGEARVTMVIVVWE